MNISAKYLLGTALLAAAFGAQPALAETKDANLDVTATVTNNCTISTTPVAFGNIDVTLGASKDGTGGLTITCTAGTVWNAFANEGAGAGATLNVRKMTMTAVGAHGAGTVGTTTLNYTLYNDSARTGVWDSLDGDYPINGTGTGSSQNAVVYGTILAGQTTVPAGQFKDTVVVTLAF